MKSESNIDDGARLRQCDVFLGQLRLRRPPRRSRVLEYRRLRTRDIGMDCEQMQEPPPARGGGGGGAAPWRGAAPGGAGQGGRAAEAVVQLRILPDRRRERLINT